MTKEQVLPATANARPLTRLAPMGEEPILFSEVLMSFDSLSSIIIDSAYEVHRSLGVGFLERVYQMALAHELGLRGLSVEIEKPIDVFYKDQKVGFYEADLLIDSYFIVEIKTCSRLIQPHIQQTKHYLKATGFQHSLLFNFKASRLEYLRVFP